MQYPKSTSYEGLIKGKIMGPNPVKLTEELLMGKTSLQKVMFLI